jgi:hypothetical protein
LFRQRIDLDRKAEIFLGLIWLQFHHPRRDATKFISSLLDRGAGP